MTSTILIAIALVLLVTVAARLLLPAGRPALFPYSLKAALFSPAERSFLGVLEQAVGSHYCIFGKVRIADVVATKRGLNGSQRQSAFNRINAKHFDFLLCDKQDLSIVCAIELDDRSHGRASRQQRDTFVTELCRNVGLPLLRIRASRSYSLPERNTKAARFRRTRSSSSSLPICLPIRPFGGGVRKRSATASFGGDSRPKEVAGARSGAFHEVLPLDIHTPES